MRAALLFAVLATALPLAAATRTWTGTNSGAWSDAGNWSGTAPVAGDDLVFPAGGAQLTTTNDYSAGTSFHSITVTGAGYTLSGNAFVLGAGGLSVAVPFTLIDAPITLGAAQTWATVGTGCWFSDTGTLGLNGFTLTFDIGAAAAMSGVISGSGAIVKNNTGVLEVIAANTYSGTTAVNAGYLAALNPSALGVADGTPANGTIVNAGGTLDNGTTLGNEHVTATGYGQSDSGAIRNHCLNATFGGPLVITGSVVIIKACGGGTLLLNGPVSGTAANIGLASDGTLTLANGGNTFTGEIFVNGSGTVSVQAANALPSGARITMGSGRIALNGSNTTLSKLRGVGNLDLGTATLTITGTSYNIFSGSVSGTGTLNLNGSAAQTLLIDGDNLSTSPALIDNGSVLLIGSPTVKWFGTVVLNAGSTGYLSSARVGPVTVNNNAQLTAGGAWPFIASSSTHDLSFAAGSTYHVLLDGTAAGLYSQLSVTGSVSLGNSTLLLSPSTTFATGTQFTIIDNDGTDPVSGTFLGLPEGATFSANDQLFRITYAGGTGNDVVLSVVPDVPALDPRALIALMLVLAAAGTFFLRR